MAILARVLKFIVWLIVATWLGRKLLGWLFGSAAQPPRTTSSRTAKKLQRDPMCGTFVSPEISFPLESAGQSHHFCSAECRERYINAQRRADRVEASA